MLGGFISEVLNLIAFLLSRSFLSSQCRYTTKKTLSHSGSIHVPALTYHAGYRAQIRERGDVPHATPPGRGSVSSQGWFFRSPPREQPDCRRGDRNAVDWLQPYTIHPRVPLQAVYTRYKSPADIRAAVAFPLCWRKLTFPKDFPTRVVVVYQARAAAAWGTAVSIPCSGKISSEEKNLAFISRLV